MIDMENRNLQRNLDPNQQWGLYWREIPAYKNEHQQVSISRTGPMDNQQPISEPLDATWLFHLRQRYAEIAARRVPESAVDDVVQDAMGIVLSKGLKEARNQGLNQPSVRWSFTVLRNVIGNYYQKRREHEQLDDLQLSDQRPDALAALTSEERRQTIRSAVDELGQKRPNCAHWLWSLAQGEKAGPLALKAQLDRSAFYRKIYKCRLALAEILRGKGVTA